MIDSCVQRYEVFWPLISDPSVGARALVVLIKKYSLFIEKMSLIDQLVCLFLTRWRVLMTQQPQAIEKK